MYRRCGHHEREEHEVCQGGAVQRPTASTIPVSTPSTTRRQQLSSNAIGFQPIMNAASPQGVARGAAVTPYATHVAGAVLPIWSKRTAI